MHHCESMCDEHDYAELACVIHGKCFSSFNCTNRAINEPCMHSIEHRLYASKGREKNTMGQSWACHCFDNDDDDDADADEQFVTDTG